MIIFANKLQNEKLLIEKRLKIMKFRSDINPIRQREALSCSHNPIDFSIQDKIRKARLNFIEKQINIYCQGKSSTEDLKKILATLDANDIKYKLNHEMTVRVDVVENKKRQESLLKKRLGVMESMPDIHAIRQYEKFYFFHNPIDFSSQEKIRKACLSGIERQINDYCQAAPAIEDLEKILAALSVNNIKDRFDYGWVYEERHSVFSEAVKEITQKLNLLLQQRYKLVTLRTLSNIISYLSTWEFKPSEEFVVILLKKANYLCKQGCLFSPESAFKLLDGLDRMFYLNERIFRNISEKDRVEFFYTILDKALSLLMKNDISVIEGAPFLMVDNYMNFPFFRRSSVLNLAYRLLKQDHIQFRKYQEFLIPCIMLRNNEAQIRKICASIARNQEQYPGLNANHLLASCLASGSNGKQIASVIYAAIRRNPRCRLFLELEGEIEFIEDSNSLWNDSVEEDNKASKEKIVKEVKEYVYYFPLEIYKRNLRALCGEDLYRGFMWFLKKYSEGINFSYSNNMNTICSLSSNIREMRRIHFGLKDINCFLKVVKNIAADIPGCPEISRSGIFQILFKAAIAPYNIEEFRSESGWWLDILWVNMMLSIALNDASIAYTMAEQSQIFGMITGMNPDCSQARALYEIRTMRWNGGVTFEKSISESMEQHFKTFNDTSSPSLEEEEWYDNIKAKLNKENREKLKHDFICPATGHEIDIAYLPKKIAIHIDGPSHRNTLTGSRTIKTIFRDKCLEAAGWQSIVINLVNRSRKEEDELLGDIAKKLNEDTLILEVFASAARNVGHNSGMVVPTAAITSTENATGIPGMVRSSSASPRNATNAAMRDHKHKQLPAGIPGQTSRAAANAVVLGSFGVVTLPSSSSSSSTATRIPPATGGYARLSPITSAAAAAVAAAHASVMQEVSADASVSPPLAGAVTTTSSIATTPMATVVDAASNLPTQEQIRANAKASGIPLRFTTPAGVLLSRRGNNSNMLRTDGMNQATVSANNGVAPAAAAASVTTTASAPIGPRVTPTPFMANAPR